MRKNGGGGCFIIIFFFFVCAFWPLVFFYLVVPKYILSPFQNENQLAKGNQCAVLDATNQPTNHECFYITKIRSRSSVKEVEETIT